MEIIRFKGGYDSNFTYLLIDDNEAILIDSFIDKKIDDKLDELIQQAKIKTKNFKLKYILSTHSHFNHIEGNEHYKEKYNAKIIMHVLSEKNPDIRIMDGDKIIIGKKIIHFLHTPGHTMDSICLLVDDKIFTGDTLFVGCVGRTDFGGNLDDLKKTMARLKKLDNETIIYPSHNYGETPTSTIGRKRK